MASRWCGIRDYDHDDVLSFDRIKLANEEPGTSEPRPPFAN